MYWHFSGTDASESDSKELTAQVAKEPTGPDKPPRETSPQPSKPKEEAASSTSNHSHTKIVSNPILKLPPLDATGKDSGSRGSLPHTDVDDSRGKNTSEPSFLDSHPAGEREKNPGNEYGPENIGESPVSPHEESKLAAVPDAEAQEAAMKLAKGLFKEELAKAKSNHEKRRAFARKLLLQAKSAKVADVETYVLLRLAQELSLGALNIQGAFETIEAMSDRYRIDAIDMKSDVLSSISKKVHTPPQHVSVADQAVRLMAEAAEAEKYEQALELAKLAISEGGAGHDKELVAHAKARLQEIRKDGRFISRVSGGPGDVGQNAR